MAHRRWPADPESVEAYLVNQIGKLEAQLRAHAGACRIVVYTETSGDLVAALVTSDHRQVARMHGSTLAAALAMLSTDPARSGIDLEPVLTAADPRVVLIGIDALQRFTNGQQKGQ